MILQIIPPWPPRFVIITIIRSLSVFVSGIILQLTANVHNSIPQNLSHPDKRSHTFYCFYDFILYRKRGTCCLCSQFIVSFGKHACFIFTHTMTLLLKHLAPNNPYKHVFQTMFCLSPILLKNYYYISMEIKITM